MTIPMKLNSGALQHIICNWSKTDYFVIRPL